MAKKSIILTSNDVPTFKELLDAVSRLRKDYLLLTRIKGSKDKENPESMKIVAAFLEMLAKREKRNLSKSESLIDDTHDTIIQMLCDELSKMDDWELKQTIRETDLSKIFKKELFDD